MAWRRWASSPATTTGSGASSVTGRSGACATASLHASAARTVRSTGARSISRVWSSRARRRRSSTRSRILDDSSSIRRRIVGRSTGAASPPSRNSSAKPWIDVSGVRSSCEASARNCRRRRSVSSRSLNAPSMSSSMVLSARPSSPTSVGPASLTRCDRSPDRDRPGRARHALERA